MIANGVTDSNKKNKNKNNKKKTDSCDSRLKMKLSVIAGVVSTLYSYSNTIIYCTVDGKNAVKGQKTKASSKQGQIVAGTNSERDSSFQPP